MAINVNSEAECRKAYLNYHCYGNSMGISAEDMGRITAAYEGRIASWQDTVTSDETEYDFDDSEYSKYIAEGKKAAKDKTGCDAKNAGDYAESVGGALTSAGVGFFAVMGSTVVGKAAEKVVEETIKQVGNEVVKETTETVIKEGVKEVTKKTAEATAEEAAKLAGKEAMTQTTTMIGGTAVKEGAKESGKKALKNSASWSIAAPMAAGLATKYKVEKPNKKEKEACDALQIEMGGAQAQLSQTQSDMATMNAELTELSDEAYAYNEDANEEIEEQKTEYDDFLETFTELQDKIDNGESLSDSEKDLYMETHEMLNESGILIQEISDETSEEVTALYEEMDTYQDGYDIAAESMGEVQGLTDHAASFDEATQTMCYIETASQTLNAASGAKAGYQAGAAAVASLGFNAWAWACAAMGTGAALVSGLGANEQREFAGEIGNEIDMRENTEDINTMTMDMYVEEVDTYDGYMQGVEDLTIEIPENEDLVETQESLEELEEVGDTEEVLSALPEEEEGSEGGSSPSTFGIPTQPAASTQNSVAARVAGQPTQPAGVTGDAQQPTAPANKAPAQSAPMNNPMGAPTQPTTSAANTQDNNGQNNKVKDSKEPDAKTDVKADATKSSTENDANKTENKNNTTGVNPEDKTDETGKEDDNKKKKPEEDVKV